MSVLSALGQQLVRLGSRLLGKPLTAGSNVFTVSTPEVYASIDSKNAIEEGFNSNTAVYSVVMKDADKFGSIPRFVYDAKKREEKAKKWKRYTHLEHKASPSEYFEGAPQLTELLNRPNKYQGADLFLTTFRCYWKVSGESFIWLNRGDLEPYRLEDGSFDDIAINRLPVLEMYILPANLITLIPDPTDLWGVLGYILEVGQRVYIRKDDVIHIKMPNLTFDAASRDHLRGMTPLKPGAKTLGENNAMALASMRQAQNDGAKYVLFNETMGSMTPAQQTELKRVIDKKINNNDVAGAVATLQGKWGGIDLGKSSHDMELMAAKEMSWKEICFLFKVPYEFFDSHTPYAEKQLTQFGWLTNDLIPACKQLDAELNRTLLKAFNLEGKAIICTDASDLPEMITAMVEAAKAMQELWCLTPDDVREFLGHEPLGGEFAEPWIPSGRSPMSHMQSPEDEVAQELEMMRVYESANRTGNSGPGNGKVSQNGQRAKV